jgi:hypothetical protein
MSERKALVVTTIRIPSLLVEYAKNFKRYEHQGVYFIIVGDLKTPEQEVHKVARALEKEGYEAYFLDKHSQKEWLKQFPKLDEIIPYNSDNRRNIGFLFAVEKGCDLIISIDDDNYVTEEDYLLSHSVVGKELELPCVSSENGWFNPCSLLEVDPPRVIYSRGYPYIKRFKEEKITYRREHGRIVLNMGLWLGHPDVDAITNLNGLVKVVKMKDSVDRIMLAPGTYSPINTQNTCFHKRMLPCYYYIVMGANIKGLTLDRYGDIWSGLFAKKCADSVGDRFSIGEPLTYHDRNPHNLFKDLMNELWGIIITDKLVQELKKIDLSSKNYFDCYLELADELEKVKLSLSNEHSIIKYFEKLTQNMRIWVKTCEKLL